MNLKEEFSPTKEMYDCEHSTSWLSMNESSLDFFDRCSIRVSKMTQNNISLAWNSSSIDISQLIEFQINNNSAAQNFQNRCVTRFVMRIFHYYSDINYIPRILMRKYCDAILQNIVRVSAEVIELIFNLEHEFSVVVFATSFQSRLFFHFRHLCPTDWF